MNRRFWVLACCWIHISRTAAFFFFFKLPSFCYPMINETIQNKSKSCPKPVIGSPRVRTHLGRCIAFVAKESKSDLHAWHLWLERPLERQYQPFLLSVHQMLYNKGLYSVHRGTTSFFFLYSSNQRSTITEELPTCEFDWLWQCYVHGWVQICLATWWQVYKGLMGMKNIQQAQEHLQTSHILQWKHHGRDRDFIGIL